VLRLTRPAIGPRLHLSVYAVAILFALDSFREAISGAPMLEPVLLAMETVAGIATVVALLAWGPLRRVRDGGDTGWLRVLRRDAVAVALVLAGALVAGAAGYMGLARLLASGLLGGGALALTLYASVLVVDATVSLALRVWPLRLLRMAQGHRELLERRVHRLTLSLAVVGWVARMLDRAGLFQAAWSLGETILGARIGRGAITLSVGDALEFFLTVWVAYLISAFLRFVLQEEVYPRARMTRGISYAVSSLLNYIIVSLGFVLALGTLGLDVTKLTVLAGALGVGIGFGLQNVVNNFVSGLILLFERPIHVGDVIEMDDLLGEVARIGIRASTVRTYRGADGVVPNAQLVAERVTNWTLSDRRRRNEVPVGVDYGSAPEKVVQVLESVARAHPDILKDPAPVALFMSFADSAINFELRAWTHHFERWPKIRTDLAVGIHAGLRAAGITIPYPQREVRLLRGATDGSATPPDTNDRRPGAPTST
jgi:small-conductance mechanosensitive channel